MRCGARRSAASAASGGNAIRRLIRLRSAGCSGASVGAAERRGHPLLPRLAQHRGDPRVRVLDVVDGVLGRLLAGEVEVEVDRRVVRALQQEEARRVDPDLVHEVVERHELAPALGHRRALAALDDVDELHDHELELPGLAAEGLEVRPSCAARSRGGRRPTRRSCGRSSRAALVLVVGDVGGEVGVLAARALEHAVLLVPELRSSAATARPRCGRSRRAARARRSCAAPPSASPRAARRSENQVSKSTRKRCSVARMPSSMQLDAGACDRVDVGRRPRRGCARPARPRRRPRSRPRAPPPRALGPGSTRPACCTWLP